MHEEVMVQPIHTAVKGRARFKVEGLHGCRPLKEHLVEKLFEHESVTEVSPSTVTGKVLVRFNGGNDIKKITALIESLVQEYHGANPQRSGASREMSLSRRSSLRLPKPNEDRPVPEIVEASKLAAFGQMARESQSVEPWHTLSPEAAVEAFNSSAAMGLAAENVLERLERYGANALPENSARSGWSIFVDQFTSLPVALLGAAAGVSIATGGLVDAVVIMGVVAINGVIGYFTESEAERTINSLKDLVKPTADILRDGAVATVPAEEVVPGDVLVLRPGAYVAADARLIEANHLSVDESVLTGESMPAVKTVEALVGSDIPLGDRLNMVYMGTLVTGGQGVAVVVGTGAATEVGRLQALVGEASSPETPMERQLNRLGDQLVLISGAACAVVFGIGLLRGYGILTMFKTAISLAVAAVPGSPTGRTAS